jgi:hypothetical protein
MSQARWEDNSTQARAAAEHGEPFAAAEASVPVISGAIVASDPMPTALAARRIGGTGGRFMSSSLADSAASPTDDRFGFRGPVPVSETYGQVSGGYPLSLRSN